MALPFAHLCGRPMWERCDHQGTRLDGAPAGVRLAAAPPPLRREASVDTTWRKAWEVQRGAAVHVPSGPADCEEHQVLLLDPERGLMVLEAQGWRPLAEPPPRLEAAAGAPLAPSNPPLFQPAAATPPDRPAGLTRDPWDGLWLLDRSAGALRRLDGGGRVTASVPLPPGCQPRRFGCTALGLVVADQGGVAGAALLFRPWQGEWRGLRLTLPPEPAPEVEAGADSGATTGSALVPMELPELIDLAADPAFGWAAGLIRQGQRHGLVVWDGRRRRHWLAPTLCQPRHLVIDGPESVLVSEPPWLPGDSRSTPFKRLEIRSTGLEEEGNFSVRGFDGRALWRDGASVWASTAFGARALLAKEPVLRESGRIETWALDSGAYACHWHRLFVDVCLPTGTRVWVEARSGDDLPPWEVRRGARSAQDKVSEKAADPSPPSIDDPWPPLASRTADDREGWQCLAVADRLPPLIDQPLEQPQPGQIGMETLEWLVSTPPGRYLWLRLHLEGDGRRSPMVYALRVSHPRPALLERLPAFWRSEPEGSALSERLLALFEGPISELDHRAEALMRLFLPALTPAEALPWLAGFLALSYHDLVPLRVRRQLLAEIAELYRKRGTLPGLERLLSILTEADVTVLESFRLRRRRAVIVGEATVLGPALELGGREGLLADGRTAPNPFAMDPLAIGARGDDEQRLALGHGVLLAHRASESRAGRAPCPVAEPPSPEAPDSLRAWFRQRAHRFTVLIPQCHSAALEAVLEQALELHKPAHTLHELCWLEAGYCLERGVLVGLQRLGLAPRASPPVLGQALLGGGSDPLGGAPSSHPCGPEMAVMPFLPMRPRQP